MGDGGGEAMEMRGSSWKRRSLGSHQSQQRPEELRNRTCLASGEHE